MGLEVPQEVDVELIFQSRYLYLKAYLHGLETDPSEGLELEKKMQLENERKETEIRIRELKKLFKLIFNAVL